MWQALARAAVAAGRVLGPLASKLARGGKELAKNRNAQQEAAGNTVQGAVGNAGEYVDDPRRPFQTGHHIIDYVGNMLFGDHTPPGWGTDDYNPRPGDPFYEQFSEDYPAPGPGDDGNEPTDRKPPKDGKGSRASIAMAKEIQRLMSNGGRQNLQPDNPAGGSANPNQWG
jgi:hypothetical protein